MQRVFDEIEFVRNTTTYQPGQVARIRDALRREFERNSEDNGYVLNQIARRYADGDTATLVDRRPPGPHRGADRRRDPGGGSHLPEYEELCEGDADAGGSSRGSRARGFAGSLTGSFDAAG